MKKLIGFIILCIGLSVSAQTTSEIYQTKDGAIKGYDAVAYFTQKKAVKGSKQFAVSYKEAIWYFSSAENKEAFRVNPFKYAPQYGGYCAYGVANDNLVKVEPDQFTIYEGKLYLNYDAAVQKDWLKDIPGYNKKADAKFKSLLAK